MKEYFKCEICGKIYGDSKIAVECETKCKVEQTRKEKLKEEKDSRYKEIQDTSNKLTNLVEKYNKDYPSSTISFFNADYILKSPFLTQFFSRW